MLPVVFGALGLMGAAVATEESDAFGLGRKKRKDLDKWRSGKRKGSSGGGDRSWDVHGGQQRPDGRSPVLYGVEPHQIWARKGYRETKRRTTGPVVPFKDLRSRDYALSRFKELREPYGEVVEEKRTDLGGGRSQVDTLTEFTYPSGVTAESLAREAAKEATMRFGIPVLVTFDPDKGEGGMVFFSTPGISKLVQKSEKKAARKLARARRRGYIDDETLAAYGAVDPYITSEALGRANTFSRSQLFDSVEAETALDEDDLFDIMEENAEFGRISLFSKARAKSKLKAVERIARKIRKLRDKGDSSKAQKLEAKLQRKLAKLKKNASNIKNAKRRAEVGEYLRKAAAIVGAVLAEDYGASISRSEMLDVGFDPDADFDMEDLDLFLEEDDEDDEFGAVDPYITSEALGRANTFSRSQLFDSVEAETALDEDDLFDIMEENAEYGSSHEQYGSSAFWAGYEGRA
jgi:hypothetical protein